MHWDFRLELDGVLKSWAIPKGPSLVAGERRMAVQTEDHPADYADFEGVIPKGQYGGGTVLVWDRGSWQPIGAAKAGLARGKLDFLLFGEKLRGRWHLVRMRARPADRGRSTWLLIKGRDDHARPADQGEIATREPLSVVSGRDLSGVATDEPGRRARRGRTARKRSPPVPLRAEVQLATLVDSPPEGGEWIHEVKLDGYRLLAFLDRGTVRLVSRNAQDWTHRFPRIAAAVRDLPLRSAVLDGEVVVFDAAGRSSFQKLQAALGSREGTRETQLVLFDCLHLDGRDLRELPLGDRRSMLRSLLARATRETPLRFSDHVMGHGAQVLAAACESGLEGVVSKRIDAPYRAGRGRTWLKTKCSRRQEFVILGFTEPGGSRVGFGALLLGARDSNELRYCGKVGTGFDRAGLSALHARLAALEQPQSALDRPPRIRDVHWVKPTLVAEVSFGEWTRDGLVRQPVFQGVREDKPASGVRLESDPPARRRSTKRARASGGAERDVIAGVRLSNPDRVYFPDPGVTKRELAEYYEAMAERVLPGLIRRPLTMLRCPEGIEGACFYQKHANQTLPDSIRRVRVGKRKPPYAMITDLASLISLVQIGVLELHIWGARADRLDRPDLVTFDLDPDPSVSWARVVETARALRSYLDDLGLVPFVRLTGGKGLHIVTPIVRRASWDQVRGFSRGIAHDLVKLAPAQLTAQMSKARRKGRIFIDWMRNSPEATCVASYSVRARPGAPVALPVSWEELEGLEGALRENPRQALHRLGRPDPWARFEASRRPISRSALERLADS